MNGLMAKFGEVLAVDDEEIEEDEIGYSEKDKK